MIKEQKNLETHYDLMDSQISICSPVVPQLFTDNFDYQTREDFIKGILENEEVFMVNSHLYLIFHSLYL